MFTNKFQKSIRNYLVAIVASFVIILFWNTPANAFVLLGSSWLDGEATVNVDIEASNPADTSNAPNTVSNGPTNAEFQSAYIDAINIWTNNSSFNYSADTASGAVDPCPSPSVEPGNGVKFSTDDCTGVFDASTLAVQFTWSFGEVTLKTGTIFNNAFSWDIYSGPWTGVAEFKRVAIHELGHGLGLDHTTIFPAIMQALAPNAAETPQSDDLSGADFLYDIDSDNLGIANDNCPSANNPSQLDTDADSFGDDCDADIDGDAVFDKQGTDASFGMGDISNSLLFVYGPNFYAQTFPATVSGQISTINLPVFCDNGSITVTIRELQGILQRPTGSQLANQNFNITSYTGFTTINFTTPFNVVAGMSYAIVASYPAGFFVDNNNNDLCYWITTNNSSNYPNGQAWGSSNSGTNWGFLGIDLPFSTVLNPTIIDNCPLDINPAQTDSDNDGIGDVCEIPDMDNDGIEDSVDNCPNDANPMQENNDNDLFGDICDNDDDNDGLDDADELLLNTDPFNPDSDNDNLLDGEEVNIYLTDPNDADTDNDGVSDGDEVSQGSDPLSAPIVNIPMMNFISIILMSIVIFILALMTYRIKINKE